VRFRRLCGSRVGIRAVGCGWEGREGGREGGKGLGEYEIGNKLQAHFRLHIKREANLNFNAPLFNLLICIHTHITNVPRSFPGDASWTAASPPPPPIINNRPAAPSAASLSSPPPPSSKSRSLPHCKTLCVVAPPRWYWWCGGGGRRRERSGERELVRDGCKITEKGPTTIRYYHQVKSQTHSRRMRRAALCVCTECPREG
jgi:hypothetical protein